MQSRSFKIDNCTEIKVKMMSCGWAVHLVSVDTCLGFFNEAVIFNFIYRQLKVNEMIYGTLVE